MRFSIKFLKLLTVLSLCSCQVYRSNFDCCPVSGVPCTSVTELESMIVETQKGPDILLTCQLCTPSEDPCFDANHYTKRIWLNDRILPDGSLEQGHYVYFQTCEVDL